MAVPGSGYKIADDVLTDISYVLVEPVVNTTLGTNVAPGVQTVTPGSMASIYVGAQIVVGRTGFIGHLPEVVTVTAVTSTTFTATYTQIHDSTTPIFGATFPVGENNNPFFTQNEMLQYLSNAQNDFLTACPMILNVTTQNFGPAQRIGTIPSDAIQIERISQNGYYLYEQSQTGTDWLLPTWQTATPANPRTWFQDRLNFETFGVQPVPLNTFTLELTYAQRDSALLQLNEGFLLPDQFLTYVKYGVLAQCFGKDGEMRDPARAKYCEQRFGLGVKIGRKFYENAKMQEVVQNG